LDSSFVTCIATSAMVSLPCEAAPDVAIVGDRNRIHTPYYEKSLIIERPRRSKNFFGALSEVNAEPGRRCFPVLALARRWLRDLSVFARQGENSMRPSATIKALSSRPRAFPHRPHAEPASPLAECHGGATCRPGRNLGRG